MNDRADLTSFASWYKLLVKNKMAGPALSFAGVAIGNLLIQLIRTTPAPYDKNVGIVGLTVLDISAGVWILLMIGFGFFWLRFIARKRNFP